MLTTFFLFEQPVNAVRLEKSSSTDGTISCTFTRNSTTTIEDKSFDLTNTPYYLLLAAGKNLRCKCKKVRVDLFCCRLIIDMLLNRIVTTNFHSCYNMMKNPSQFPI